MLETQCTVSQAMAEPSLFYWHLCSSKILITNEPRICFMLEFCPDYGSRCKLGYNCSRLDCFHLDTCHREQRLIIGVRSLNLSLECQMGVMTASGSYLLECLGQHQNQMWTQGLQHQSDQLELSDRDGSQAVGVIPKCFLYKQYVVIWLYSSNMYEELKKMIA